MEHSVKEGLTFQESFEDLIEFALLVDDENRAKLTIASAKTDQWELVSVALKVSYPLNGPLAGLTGEEKGLIGGMLLECLDLAVNSVLVSRSHKEKLDVMERAGKGMGTGESSVSVI